MSDQEKNAGKGPSGIVFHKDSKRHLNDKGRKWLKVGSSRVLPLLLYSTAVSRSFRDPLIPEVSLHKQKHSITLWISHWAKD